MSEEGRLSAPVSALGLVVGGGVVALGYAIFYAGRPWSLRTISVGGAILSVALLFRGVGAFREQRYVGAGSLTWIAGGFLLYSAALTSSLLQIPFLPGFVAFGGFAILSISTGVLAISSIRRREKRGFAFLVAVLLAAFLHPGTLLAVALPSDPPVLTPYDGVGYYAVAWVIVGVTILVRKRDRERPCDSPRSLVR